jgi:4,5:9,10-diseco-3-hydroxy-5,9,17-trioxoandrosta-1(10),2-diene-4-oate hydrolase
VFALDLPGHGYTQRYRGPHSIEYFTQFIDGFITAQNLQRVHLLGNSFGGGVALQYAVRYPGKTDKLILVANPGFGRELSLPLRLIGIPLVGKYFIRSRKSEASRHKRSMAILKGILHDVDHVDAATREVLLGMYSRMGALREGGWAVYDILRRYTDLFGIKKSFMGEFNRIVRSVEAAALIIWGENDRVIPPEHGTLGLNLMRNARLHTINECGHMPQLEHPAEFNRVVLEFLNPRLS